MANPKPRLGRGLGGLIAQGSDHAKAVSTVEVTSRLQSLRVEVDAVEPDRASLLGGYTELPVGIIVANPFQPRKEMDDEALSGLAESIREEGLLQPIVVRQVGEVYELIAGERRLRAFRKLGMPKIPARVIEATDASSATLALIENLQREGLNPIEEALGYASLIRDFDLTQEKAADRLGKNRASVANVLRLLRLPVEVQAYVSKSLITAGHAKVILSLDHSAQQQAFARQVLEKGWSVREAERQVQRFKREEDPLASGSDGKQAGRSVPRQEETAVRDLEKRIASLLTAEVALKHRKGKSQLVIHYQGLDELQRILEKIGVGNG
jgi:ParB family chromosome partitioning protein